MMASPGVPSLQACCLDFLSEGMRGAEHHEMRTTFLRHLCDNAEKSQVLETFIAAAAGGPPGLC